MFSSTPLRALRAAALAASLMAVAMARCEAQAAMPPMAGMSAKIPAMQNEAPKDGMGMSTMSMQSSVSLTDPMSREGSGTAWLPDSSPMYGFMKMYSDGDSLMLHGAAMPRYDNVGSKRGGRDVDAPNWFMGMFGHPLSDSSQIGLRAMISLDPLTEQGHGYPLLFQSGETWNGRPLRDHQHPHDLFDELSATYSMKVGKDRSAYLYLAYPGEPALGPPTYMHRLIAYDLADAPIGHHWEDATHVTFGVATLGCEITNSLKIEGSSFTGREPDENRYNFDRPRFDSQSIRLDWNPNSRNALEISHGFIKNPEGDGVAQHRVTASWIYDNPLRGDRNFTTTLLTGQNDADEGEGVSNAYLEELDYQEHSNTVFARLEQIQKSGDELVLPEPFSGSKLRWFDAYTIGYVRDLRHGTGVDTGLGAALTLDSTTSALSAVYGGGTPLSFQIFLRFRPSRSMAMGGSGMNGASAQMRPGGGMRM